MIARESFRGRLRARSSRVTVAGLVVTVVVASFSGISADPASALRKASHDGWPTVDGMLLINKFDQPRALDARPGADPFDGTDSSYRCDGDHAYQGCFVQAGACVPLLRHANFCALPPVVSQSTTIHNELLGGHGSDTIYAGPGGDILWGDYKPSGQGAEQRDSLTGGAGDDFIYTSHGTNVVHTGGGTDVVHAHFGRGQIFCDSKTTLVYLSHRSSREYTLHGCGRTTFKPAGTEPA